MTQYREDRRGHRNAANSEAQSARVRGRWRIEPRKWCRSCLIQSGAMLGVELLRELLDALAE